jgi:hypothetical protein
MKNKPVPKNVLAVMESENLFNATELEMRFPIPTEFRREHPLLRDATLTFADKIRYYKAAIDSIPRDSILALADACREVIEGGSHNYQPPTLVGYEGQ